MILNRSSTICLTNSSVAGFGFYDGPELIKLMKLGDELSMIPNSDNLYDEYAVELHWKDNLVGHIPRSDNRHIFSPFGTGHGPSMHHPTIEPR